MNELSLVRVSVLALVFCSLIMLVLFGSLAASVQSCNIEAWFEVVRPVLGVGAVGSVKTIWTVLFFLLLIPLGISFKVSGRSKCVLAVWSTTALILLVAIRNIELAPNC